MFKKLFKCIRCNTYMLEEYCKKCKTKNINPSYKYIKYKSENNLIS